ncbi:hypothetical protein BBJ28_00026643 [Nothophytophthora sp. Chile5]|nr:hypothetical protein BBJ28_00026643 [Nothophytophthora sp. Chile5]
MELPGAYYVTLTIKVGASRASSRTTYRVVTDLQLVLSEGYTVFHEKIKRIFAGNQEVEWVDSQHIMLKPTSNATQAQYEMLLSDDVSLRQQLTRLWGLAARRKSGQGAFKLELYIYVSRVSTNPTLRRATPARVAIAASQINAHISSSGSSEQYGPASQAYWAITQARQPENAPLVEPTGSAFVQLRHIDQQQHMIDSRTEAASVDAEYATVRCRLNGGLVPLDLHVGDLRAVLGLPPYPSRPPFREPIEVQPPNQNMEDVDHCED